MKEQITGSDWRGRRAGMLVGALGLVLALVLLVGILPAYAQDDERPPRVPHYFAGTVSTSSGPVPEGTVVQAFLGGVEISEAKTDVSAQSTYELLVPGGYDDDGKTVSFTVGGAQASQTAAWEEYGVDANFDLTISALPDGSWFDFLPFDCFIATAAYGTDTTEEINLLREFRDVVLLASSPGSEFISLYYQVSPPIAEVISRHECLGAVVRVGFIDPIVSILNWGHALWLETEQ